jgi:hypothetical protein
MPSSLLDVQATLESSNSLGGPPIGRAFALLPTAQSPKRKQTNALEKSVDFY